MKRRFFLVKHFSMTVTVESHCAIAIVTLKDWLKKSRASFSTNDNQNQNQLHLACACDFCRALSKLNVIGGNSDWFIGLFA